MTVSNKRNVIYDDGLMGTGQSFCNFYEIKVHCKDSVHSLHERSLGSVLSVQQELKRCSPKCCKCTQN